MIMEFTYYPYTEKNVSKVEKRWGVYKLANDLKKVVFILLVPDTKPFSYETVRKNVSR